MRELQKEASRKPRSKLTCREGGPEMTPDEVFKQKMGALTVWLEQFSADDCTKVLGVVHEVVEYKRTVELNLKGGMARAN
jgi:hypothetical protein